MIVERLEGRLEPERLRALLAGLVDGARRRRPPDRRAAARGPPWPDASPALSRTPLPGSTPMCARRWITARIWAPSCRSSSRRRGSPRSGRRAGCLCRPGSTCSGGRSGGSATFNPGRSRGGCTAAAGRRASRASRARGPTRRAQCATTLERRSPARYGPTSTFSKVAHRSALARRKRRSGPVSCAGDRRSARHGAEVGGDRCRASGAAGAGRLASAQRADQVDAADHDEQGAGGGREFSAGSGRAHHLGERDGRSACSARGRARRAGERGTRAFRRRGQDSRRSARLGGHLLVIAG